MYSRDPFNLRKAPPSALTYLQSAASHASTVAQRATEKAAEAVSETVQAATDKVKDADMSFKLPSNVPNFDNAQRRFEDHVWNKFSGNEKELPMYKDKPTYGTRRGGWFSGKRRIGIIALVVLGALYWIGWSNRGGSEGGVKDGKKTSWIPGGQTGKKGVDWNTRRESVKDAFLLSWKGYEEHGWGYDEYHPVARTGRFMAEPNGMGWIIVDALDTLMVMNLTKELKHAREWVSTTLNYEKNQDVNTFETTIRMLGGLLSAHYLQEALPGIKPENANDEDLFLEKAVDLADRLMGAFESPSGVPWASIILKTGEGKPSHADGGASSTAEATTLQLELKYLAYLTGEPHYWEKAEKVMEVIDNNGAKDGLVPIFVYADKGNFRGEEIRLGSRGDSYYEYLIKQYLQTQKQEPVYLDMWNESLGGVKKHLLAYSRDAHFTVLAERPSGLGGHVHPKMDHLVCFYPGTIALGVTGGLTVAEARKQPGWGKAQEDDLILARELMKTCMAMYRVNPTGLAGEITHFELADPPRMYRQEVLQSKGNLETDEDAGWKKDLIVKPADSHNLQRPETVESLFYMWRITGDELYREWGWEMFDNFVKYTIVENGGGFTSVNDVKTVPPPGRDNMESFWLAETLKYFYLLFSPNELLPLDQIVLNTEAHPFPRFDASKKRFKTGWKRIPRDEKGDLIKS
ncbi:glycoside hydrolase family 47 protein [Karstenula rhodostoma CBS 690.94]|uniref:alpha-1,2-Mannosidase n=1 Tax=Karstenula rhodostoma CBS 690.94 TaxID=1392251 RepID=A0A9P4U9F3_9PLEO|nr:glycoside hydrolase family 47 protein [Karstenula rhodostoma CBS 690.94]